MHKRADTDGPPLISLCMIVRDSSRTLGAALESVSRWVDEMIVVDTGSHDDSSLIARQCGARVFSFPWSDDFAAARNASLQHATGRWLFWMDSDDTIDENNGRKLRELVSRSPEQSPMGYVMQVHCPGPVIEGHVDVTVVDHVKMFQNLPCLRFEGRIHEQILPSIRRVNGNVEWTSVYVVHSGADLTDEGRKKKQERDLKILLLETRERPNHPFILFNLGMTYADIGRHGEAVSTLRQCLAVSSATESHVRKAYALLVGSLTYRGHNEDARLSCDDGLRLFPDDPELLFRAGVLAHRQGNLETAERHYKAAMMSKQACCFSSIDRGIVGYKARHNLAAVYSARERYDLAELQWRAIIAEAPFYRAGWRGLGESLIRQGKRITAGIEAERFPRSPELQCEADLLRCQLAKDMGNSDEARRFLERASAVLPEDLYLLQARARFFFDCGDLSAAEQAQWKVCRRVPEDGAAHHNLGMIYLRLGRMAEAIMAYRRSLAVRPDDVNTLSHLEAAIQESAKRQQDDPMSNHHSSDSAREVVAKKCS